MSNIGPHVVKYQCADKSETDPMSETTAAIVVSVLKTTRRPGHSSSTTLFDHEQTFYTKHCTAGLIKHLPPYTGLYQSELYLHCRFVHRK